MIKDALQFLTGMNNTTLGDGQGNSSVILAHGQKVVSLESNQAHPARARVNHRIDTEKSFIAYANKFGKADGSAVFVDYEALQLHFVADYHACAQPDESVNPAWCDHNATYPVPTSQEWDIWLERDATLYPREAFAMFIRENAQDCAEPDAASMETIARTFNVKRNAEFRDDIDLTSGNVSINWSEKDQVEIKGGIKFPESFIIGIPVFLGGDKYEVVCHTRYDVSGGVLKMGYIVHRPEQVKRAEFAALVARVTEEIRTPVYDGAFKLAA